MERAGQGTSNTPLRASLIRMSLSFSDLVIWRDQLLQRFLCDMFSGISKHLLVQNNYSTISIWACEGGSNECGVIWELYIYPFWIFGNVLWKMSHCVEHRLFIKFVNGVVYDDWWINEIVWPIRTSSFIQRKVPVYPPSYPVIQVLLKRPGYIKELTISCQQLKNLRATVSFYAASSYYFPLFKTNNLVFFLKTSRYVPQLCLWHKTLNVPRIQGWLLPWEMYLMFSK